MGWITDTYKKTKGRADEAVLRATPKGLRGPTQGIINTQNKFTGFLSDPLYGSRESSLAAGRESAAQREAISEKIEGLQEYEISPEAKQRMELLQQAGEGMVSGAEEATDIARMRAGMVEAPGAGQGRKDIQGATSGQIQAIQEIGGAGALGAATRVGLGQESAYEDLVRSNMAYKEESESALMGALQTEAGIRTQAAGLEAQALEGMISEKDKVYQSQLNKAQTGLQFDISQLAMDEQARAAEQKPNKILGLF